MTTPEIVKTALEKVLVPGVKRSLISLNLVKDIVISDSTVEVTLGNAALMKDTQAWLQEKVTQTLLETASVKEAKVSFTDVLPKDLNKVKNVIAIMSGKGGVGKSLVSGLTAIALRRQGFEVGILDADITGPSIPKMFGVSGLPAMSESGMLPAPSRSGIGLMSINLLLQTEDDAVIWRGPLIGQAITQFWNEVLWGNLDYLIVDLPPGTADAPLTVMQQLPISGIIIVFTPQDLTAMVVRKALNMAKKMGKPILGVVENMSYLYVPELNKKMEIFGKSHAAEMAQSAGAPLLGQLPIDPGLAALCDAGNLERYDSEAYTAFIEKLSGALAGK
jgi:Mrp family chromosome partitioning ATPase